MFCVFPLVSYGDSLIYKKGSSICSIVRHFKKEIQEIWKPSNKHPFNKLLQWKAFGQPSPVVTHDTHRTDGWQ